MPKTEFRRERRIWWSIVSKSGRKIPPKKKNRNVVIVQSGKNIVYNT